MAMKINEPIGSAVVSPLFLRIPLGGYFLLAGYSKLHVLPAFVDQVQSLGIVSRNLSSLYATLLPYLEIYVGAALLLGLWTTLTGIMALILLGSFIFAFGLFPGAHSIFNKDVILFGVAASLLYSGPGPYSIDKTRSAG
jgi:uncharacterized membrane protein YphA (DoxX/SURF4 family)